MSSILNRKATGLPGCYDFYIWVGHYLENFIDNNDTIAHSYHQVYFNTITIHIRIQSPFIHTKFIQKPYDQTTKDSLLLFILHASYRTNIPPEACRPLLTEHVPHRVRLWWLWQYPLVCPHNLQTRTHSSTQTVLFVGWEERERQSSLCEAHGTGSG